MVQTYLRSLQDDICTQLEALDGGRRFREDLWEHHSGGGGRTRVLEGGDVFERGGVNFSAVEGDMTPKMLQVLQVAPRTDAPVRFTATGVSLVLHPRNPLVPIVHMNVRYFEMTDGTWWFGGGIDLTPIYVDQQDARSFHGVLRDACERHGADFYPAFKRWADDYFFLSHRAETRGVGGIFFDRLGDGEGFEFERRFAFLREIGDAFCPSYLPIVRKNKDLPYGQRERDWQSLRRGRYVEFNLVHDRGTKFGLETNGRTESILMSMPPHAEWKYDFRTEPGSPEEETQNWLRKGVDWG
jgi:coproporphyrinogen III oxidase